MKSWKEAPREELIEMVEVMNAFIEGYKKLIIEKGIMKEEELVKYEFGFCEKYAREKYPFLFNFIEEKEERA